MTDDKAAALNKLAVAIRDGFGWTMTRENDSRYNFSASLIPEYEPEDQPKFTVYRDYRYTRFGLSDYVRGSWRNNHSFCAEIKLIQRYKPSTHVNKISQELSYYTEHWKKAVQERMTALEHAEAIQPVLDAMVAFDPACLNAFVNSVNMYSKHIDGPEDIALHIARGNSCRAVINGKSGQAGVRIYRDRFSVDTMDITSLPHLLSVLNLF